MVVNSDSKLLRDLFNAFKPDMPLEPGDSRYVDCKDVRGDEDILTEVGGYIIKSDANTYQLYSGHRGGGKSTELKRLEKHLEENQFLVVYFAAATENEGDLSFQNAQYQDILLSCTRRLLTKLEGHADVTPIANWLRDRWQELEDLALTNVSLENLTVSAAVAQFVKITATVRTEPGKREEIRKLVEGGSESLVEALNEFIRDAKQKAIQDGQQGVAIVVDNLDRMVPILLPDGSLTNLEDIYINRSEAMRGLDCHIVYTAPTSLLYSKSSSDLQDIYGRVHILPMVMVQSPDGEIHEPGMEKLRQAIAKRVEQVSDRPLIPEIFASQRALDLLCANCGGHWRDLLQMAREAANKTLHLPISEETVKRAVTDYRQGYVVSVLDTEWDLLLQVRKSKDLLNDESYRDLLKRRCILEYCFYDEEMERRIWYDVHPLILGSRVFKERWEAYQNRG